MSRFQFDLATSADDADLRAVLRATPMGGNPSLVFLREPSFFDAAQVEGRFHQVIGCRDTTSGHIVGFGTRSVMDRYLNGKRQPIGYLSSLRLLPEHRNRGLLARGFAFFRDLHADARTSIYLTTVADGSPAVPLLASGRAGLPRYHDAGRYFTIAIPVPRSQPRNASRFRINSATEEDRVPILEFIRAEGPRRQFFPAYEFDDLHSRCGLLRDLPLGDMCVARDGAKLIGLLASWDQRAFKQTVVHAYSNTVNLVRPAWNFWTRMAGQSPLPPPGESIRHVIAALPLIARDDPDVFADLLDHCLGRLARLPVDYLMLGLHEADPMLPIARSRGRAYVTRLFLVCWDDGDPLRASLDKRPPYLELGGL